MRQHAIQIQFSNPLCFCVLRTITLNLVQRPAAIILRRSRNSSVSLFSSTPFASL
jgi:hypothetical protein